MASQARTSRWAWGIAAALLLVSAAANAGERRDIVVVGGGPVGALAALELAREGHTVTLVDSHKRERTRDKTIGLQTIGVYNFARAGIQLPKNRVWGDIDGQHFEDPSDAANLANDSAPAKTRINELEEKVYREIDVWNASQPADKQIRTIFDAKVSKIPERFGGYLQIVGERLVVRGNIRVRETGLIAEARHLVVADGGRDLTEAFVDARLTRRLDRGFSDNNMRAKNPMRLRWLSDPVVDLGGGSTATFIGDALSNTHFKTGDGISKGTTDVRALVDLLRDLRGNPDAAARSAAMSNYATGRLRAAHILYERVWNRPGLKKLFKGKAGRRDRAAPLRDTIRQAQQARRRNRALRSAGRFRNGGRR